MRWLPFIKMEGAGNDYVLVDAFRDTLPVRDPARLAVALAQWHFGVGSDGLLMLSPSDRADCRMVMWNADGSRGAMCGNGLRCVAKLAFELGHVPRSPMTIETDAGVRSVELVFSPAGTVTGARVDMGDVSVDVTPQRVQIDDASVLLYRGDAGNPHAVIFAPGAVDDWPVQRLGSALQHASLFPDGVNVEFVAVVADGVLAQRTFERGSGETLACGTGATVAAAVALRTGRIHSTNVEVRLRGGTLRVWSKGAALVLEGPARSVFRGEFPLADLV